MLKPALVAAALSGAMIARSVPGARETTKFHVGQGRPLAEPPRTLALQQS